MKTRRSRDYYQARERERKYYNCGIPSKYWSDRNHSFISIAQNRKYGNEEKVFKIGAKSQRNWYEYLLDSDEKTFEENYIVGIGSMPTHEHAMVCGANIAKEAIQQKYNVKFWNSQDYIPNNIEPDVFIVWNIYKNSTNGRIQHIRDALYKFRDSFRVVIFGGTNPIEFFDEYIQIPIDMAFFVRESTQTSNNKRMKTISR